MTIKDIGTISNLYRVNILKKYSCFEYTSSYSIHLSQHLYLDLFPDPDMLILGCITEAVSYPNLVCVVFQF